jgi:hypothetical protein
MGIAAVWRAAYFVCFDPYLTPPRTTPQIFECGLLVIDFLAQQRAPVASAKSTATKRYFSFSVDQRWGAGQPDYGAPNDVGHLLTGPRLPRGSTAATSSARSSAPCPKANTANNEHPHFQVISPIIAFPSVARS